MAAIGDVKSNNNKKAVCLMPTGTVANVAAPTSTPSVGAPASAADGVPMYPQVQFDPSDTAHGFVCRDPRESTLVIKGECTAGQTLVGTFTLWGYLAGPNAWFEIPVNGGTAITPVALAETDADAIRFQQRFQNLGHYDRIALQLASIGGTGATYEAWLVTGLAGTGA